MWYAVTDWTYVHVCLYIYKTMYVDESRLAGILTDVWQLNRHKINKQEKP